MTQTDILVHREAVCLQDDVKLQKGQVHIYLEHSLVEVSLCKFTLLALCHLAVWVKKRRLQ